MSSRALKFAPSSSGFVLTPVCVSSRSPVLGASALKAAAAAATSTKRKDLPSSSESKEKRKKSALEEIMEVEQIVLERMCWVSLCDCGFWGMRLFWKVSVGLCFCSDGGEEEAVGQNRSLAAARHRGQSRHKEAGREVPQEEGSHQGNQSIPRNKSALSSFVRFRIHFTHGFVQKTRLCG